MGTNPKKQKLARYHRELANFFSLFPAKVIDINYWLTTLYQLKSKAHTKLIVAIVRVEATTS